MKKYIKDFIVKEKQILNEGTYAIIKLSPIDGEMPPIVPGQFVQVEVKDSKETFLRRPISVNFVDYENNLLWLLVRKAGKGTEKLIDTKVGDKLNIILPLGAGFSLDKGTNYLLIGGGVGVAPLLYLGKVLKEQSCNVSFLLGARSKKDLLELEEFEKYGDLYLSTEDGTAGEKGFVTMHSILKEKKFDMVSCCGPGPMMKAVASFCSGNQTTCEVSLENVMACGVGACLCCVEDTKEGNVCVCKEGPVFNIEKLKW